MQLDNTPRKRKKLHASIPQVAGPSLDLPPKPTDDSLPAPIPIEVLRGWGLQCNVPPSEVTQDALLKEKVQMKMMQLELNPLVLSFVWSLVLLAPSSPGCDLVTIYICERFAFQKTACIFSYAGHKSLSPFLCVFNEF